MSDNPTCKCGQTFELDYGEEGEVTHDLPFSHRVITFYFSCMACGEVMDKAVLFYIVPARALEQIIRDAYCNEGEEK